MTLGALALVVLASFIHAGWNLLAKRAAPAGPVFVLAYSLIACIAYAPWVLYLLAQGRIAWTGLGVGFLLLSGVIHLAYNLCLQRGYQLADLSVVYPVARGTGPLLSRQDPEGGTWRFEHTAGGRLTAVTDPTGGRTAIEHGSHGEAGQDQSVGPSSAGRLDECEHESGQAGEGQDGAERIQLGGGCFGRRRFDQERRC